MGTLSAAEISRLRDQIGDPANNPYAHLDDDALNAEYTEADDDIDTTIVFCLRRRVGLSAKWTDRSAEFNSEQRKQRFDNLIWLLKYWETKTGLGGAKLQVGLFDTDLDADIDDVQS
jgi:hypothetical protein